MNDRGDPSPSTRLDFLRPLAAAADLLWVIYLTALAVAAFAFIVSYSHIYDLGAAHAQFGTADRLLPLSVDLLIVAASLVLFRQSRENETRTGLARWLPRIVLWSGIGATVAANVAYGLPHGWLAAVISGWPGAAFVGIVEMVMVAVRPRARESTPETPVRAGQASIPSSAYEAASAAYASSVAGGYTLKEYELHKRFGIPRSQARKIVTPAPDRGRDGGRPAPVPATPEPSLNGHADGAS